MIAIVDCNSFYCSCERVFKPALWQKPVVVLSNNDGCIVARTDEAKALGIGMAGPYFMNKDLIEKHEVAVFSSNYNLYGDMSWRVMETLRMLVGYEHVEVYSVDEAFVQLHHVPAQQLQQFIVHVKQTVEQWTGIKVSIGVAPTKVLSKVANRLAKKNKAATNCIMMLQTKQQQIAALEQTDIADVWGIGRKYAYKLKKMGITNAHQLAKQSYPWAKKNLGGVVGERLLYELNGLSTITPKNPLIQKKVIATTRMFGYAVTDFMALQEAVATYVSRAAEKLRRQQGAAKTIAVFLLPKEEDTPVGGQYKHAPSVGQSTTLSIATCLTHVLIKEALLLLKKIYKPGQWYKKAGVILSDIVPQQACQTSLFDDMYKAKEYMLMMAMDNINFSHKSNTIHFATLGTTRNWAMQKNFHSPLYTTRWNELCYVT